MTDSIDDLLLQLDGEFASHTVATPDTAIHYVRGGTGPPLLLVHGFPQDWYEWRHVLPRLARSYTVHAVDLRGVGGSDAPRDGYDSETLGTDLAVLIESLALGPVHVVGHDIGGWAAYALTRLRPDLVRTLLVMETLLPGIDPPDAPAIDVPLWHIGLHLVPELPEELVQGREAIYFRHFLTTGTATPDVITDAEIEHYARAYGTRARLRAAFEVYRALPANVGFNKKATESIDVPLLLVGGEQCFGPVMPSLAAHLHTHHGWISAEAAEIEGGRHYLPEELPSDVMRLILRHAQVR